MASVMEVCWTYSLKFVSIAKLRALDWPRFFDGPAGWQTLLPAVGYLAFGVANIIFFSRAMNQIPAATAFAVWTGTALVGVKLVDTLVLREPFNPMQLVYMGLILAGIAGLRRG
jgi:quaternary ammonium compound-resistance protein SugE